MAQNRGELFEDQFKASVPPEAEVRKFATPGPRAQSMGQISEMLQRLAKKAGEEVPGWALGTLGASRHTPKQPYDMLIQAPVQPVEASFEAWWRTYLRGRGVGGMIEATPDDFVNEHDAAWAAWSFALTSFGGLLRDQAGRQMWHPARPSLPFALELKCAGSSKNLPFDRLKDHQETGLLRAAARGAIAGLVIEFPEVGSDGEVYFVPIGSYMAHKRECGRQSLSLDAARVFGQLIEVNQARGRKHRYWKVGNWLRYYGADVPAE